jgi:medium-chain acyl-[acyl-carrier-protein] hydrolase
MPEELRQVLLSRLRKDIAVGASYAYADGAPFDVPIVAYHGQSDTETTMADLESWRRHTTAGLTVRSVAGNSYFYLTDAEAVVPDLTLAAAP